VQQQSTNQQDLSQYAIEDILDCPIGSCFILCLSADGGNLEHGYFYVEKAGTIASKVKCSGHDVNVWNMSG
jgi:hypothetical protein